MDSLHETVNFIARSTTADEISSMYVRYEDVPWDTV